MDQHDKGFCSRRSPLEIISVQAALRASHRIKARDDDRY
jgi:hypothetical protein